MKKNEASDWFSVLKSGVLYVWEGCLPTQHTEDICTTSKAYCEIREKKPTRCNRCLFIFFFNNISTCFGHHYAHLQENKTYYCMRCAALVLLDVVGSGCGALRCRVRAL